LYDRISDPGRDQDVDQEGGKIMSGELVKVEGLVGIPVGKKDQIEIAQDVKMQVALLAMKTPTKYVKKRQGKGGMIWDYVEVNYVIAILNAVFRFDWDLDVIDTKIDEKNRMIAMLVELRVRFADGREVKKRAWGGSEIKYLKGNRDQKMDFANDLKGAQSDGLKKACSMINIAWDVYSGITKSKDPDPPKRDESRAGRGTEDPRKAEMNPFGSKDEEVIDVEEEESEEYDPSEVYKHDFIHKGKKYRFTKFEILKYFQEAKKNLGEKIYYTILGEFGYEKSNQIPLEKYQEIFDKMVSTWKDLDEDEKERIVKEEEEEKKKESKKKKEEKK